MGLMSLNIFSKISFKIYLNFLSVSWTQTVTHRFWDLVKTDGLVKSGLSGLSFAPPCNTI